MKTRLLCALMVGLFLITACVMQPIAMSEIRKDARTPVPAGHYSLYFVPAVGLSHVSIPVTGHTSTWQDFFNTSNGLLDAVHPRFGRSLRYPCRDG